MRIPGLLFLRTLFLVPRSLGIPGYLSRGEALALRHAACSVGVGGHVVEVGSWKGKSTYCLSRGLRPRGRITAIDPFDARGEDFSRDLYAQDRGARDLEAVFRHNLRHELRRHDFHIIRGTTADFPPNAPAIDLLFLDGDHSWEAVSSDWRSMDSHLKPGGLLLLHDCASYSPTEGPRRLRDQVMAEGRMVFIRQVDALWIGKKI